MKKYWNIKAKADQTAEILIYEQIGDDFFSQGIGAKQFAEDLKALGNVKNITLRINSPGGSVFEGLAIYNTLRAHRATKTVYIDGLAASIASVIAMSGDVILMPENSLLMLHDPSGMVIGTAQDMTKMAEALDKIKTGIISAYRSKSGMSEEEISQMMSEETWLTAKEAVDQGFADEMIGAVKVAASFDLSKFRNVPKTFQTTTKNYGGFFDMEENISHKKDMLAERERCSEISALAEKFGVPAGITTRALQNGMEIGDFKEIVLSRMQKGEAISSHADYNGSLGLSKHEQSQYSLVNAINAQITGDWSKAGLEREASRALEKKTGRKAQGFFVPVGEIKNVLTKGTPGDGGYLVGTELLAASFIDALRSKSAVMTLGPTVLTGLIGDVDIPKMSGTATAYWLDEEDAITPSGQTFNKVSLKPKSVGAMTVISRKMILQSTPAIEELVRSDFAALLGTEIDRVAIAGDDSNKEPNGILNTANIGSVECGTNGDYPTWAKIVALESEVAAANADVGSLAYVTNSKVRGRLKSTMTNATYGEVPLWTEGPDGLGRLNGYRAGVSNNVPSNLTKANGSNLSAILFGDWSSLLIGMWGIMDVLVDPYTYADKGGIRIRALLDVDLAVRHAESFAAIVDAVTS